MYAIRSYYAIRTYSKHTFDYPYPVAISVHTKDIGMEYPMICFNGGRPEPDGTYSENNKAGMIGVIVHEVGHNFFPMIVNSDERQWTWMDEGLNSFLEYRITSYNVCYTKLLRQCRLVLKSPCRSGNDEFYKPGRCGIPSLKLYVSGLYLKQA